MTPSEFDILMNHVGEAIKQRLANGQHEIIITITTPEPVDGIDNSNYWTFSDKGK
jgi:hypothetical protein